MSTMTTYQTLLLDVTPRPIRNHREYKRVMRHVDRLMKKARLSSAESQMLELLATLAEQYESVQHPTPAASQADLLAHLIDARGVSQAQVARQSGVHRSIITNVIKVMWCYSVMYYTDGGGGWVRSLGH